MVAEADPCPRVSWPFALITARWFSSSASSTLTVPLYLAEIGPSLIAIVPWYSSSDASSIEAPGKQGATRSKSNIASQARCTGALTTNSFSIFTYLPPLAVETLVEAMVALKTTARSAWRGGRIYQLPSSHPPTYGSDQRRTAPCPLRRPAPPSTRREASRSPCSTTAPGSPTRPRYAPPTNTTRGCAGIHPPPPV